MNLPPVSKVNVAAALGSAKTVRVINHDYAAS
jgi:hypothetical protein